LVRSVVDDEIVKKQTPLRVLAASGAATKRRNSPDTTLR